MNPFLENCGIRSLAVSVEREGAGPPSVHDFTDHPFLLIGRDPRGDLRLEDAAVSMRHAYLQAVGGRLFCIDLDSRTGVLWPSGRRSLGWVDWGEPLRVGRARIRVTRGRQDVVGSWPAEEDVSVSRPAPKVAFEVIEGADKPLRWGMNRLLALVGGAAPCKVRLRDARVSRFHCGLVRGALGVWVVDLLSRTGTRVNGRPVRWAQLRDGDLLQVGPYVLRVRYEAPPKAHTMLVAPAPVGGALVPGPAGYAPALADQAPLPPLFNEFQQMQQQMMGQFHQTMLMMAEMFSTLHREQAGLVREELEHLRRLTSELNALQAEKARQPAAATPALLLAAGQAAADAPPPAAKEQGKVEASPARSEVAPTPPADVHDWLSRRIDALQAERQGRWQKLLQAFMGH